MAHREHKRIILASGSAYRRELLSRVTQDFDILTPAIDESAQAAETPQQLALRLAAAKAGKIADQHPEATVIGSDQVAAAGGRPLGKPGNHEVAARQLAMCSGQPVTFYTAVCVCNQASQFHEEHVDITTVNFRTLTAHEIDAYIEADQPFDCAGSFRSEGLGIALFTSIENKDPTALIGLPMIWLTGSLRRAGIQLP